MSKSETSQLLVDRSGLLHQLDTEPKDTEALQTAVGLSASTIDRAVCELETAGYIEQIDGAYRTTLTGRLALESYDRFTMTMEGIRESIDLLGALQSDAPLTPAVLVNANVIRATRGPRAPIDRSAELLEEADRIRTILSMISSQYIDLYHEQVMDGIDASIVVSTSLIEQLITDYYDPLAEAISTGRIDLRQTTERAPFGLTIIESDSTTTMELRVHGSDGLRGLIINDTPAAIAWANGQYANTWDDALSVQTPNG